MAPPGWARLVASHAHDGLVQPSTGGRTGELGVAEGEDGTVGRDQAVAAAAPAGRDGNDRRADRCARRRAKEAGVTEGEDPSVGCGEPVTVARSGGRHADD